MADPYAPPQRPSNRNRANWRAYWQHMGQSWRTEPEIDGRHQNFLNRQRTITPDIKKGIYPFRGMKLDRADVEWLLATQGEEQEPDKCKGLDLRGAYLRKVDLHELPLQNVCMGLNEEEWFTATQSECDMAAAHLEGANLSGAHLEGANLSRAHLEGANLSGAHLESSDLFGAYLEGAYFHNACLRGANLQGAILEGAKISKVDLSGAKCDRTLMKMLDSVRSIVPGDPEFSKEFKLSDWIEKNIGAFNKGLITLLTSPLVLLIIGALLSNLLIPSYINTEQNHQKALDIKTGLINKMSDTISNALAELNAIEFDYESKDLRAALDHYYSARRDLQVNGAEIEAQLSAYFPANQQCSDKDMPKLGAYYIGRGYYNIAIAWHNYYNVALDNLFILSSLNSEQTRTDTVTYVQGYFTIYLVDHYSYSSTSIIFDAQWAALIKPYPINKYNSSKDYNKPTQLVQMSAPEWTSVVTDIANFKYALQQCILDSDIVLAR